jgi:hypothetical protein
MRRRVMVSLFAVVMSACAADSGRTPLQPETLTLPLRVEPAQHGTPAALASARGAVPENHRTHLSGEGEVFTPATPDAPTPADSLAQGQAIFQIAKDGQSFSYKLIASNIENVNQAHIHCGAATVNGPIVVWLYPGPTGSAVPSGAGRHDGVLAEDTVISGVMNHVRPASPSAQCPGGVANFADVLNKMRSGNAYVNVHTNDGVAPINTGPGDFPGGEIRGQFKAQ